jgi:hypothetical protein
MKPAILLPVVLAIAVSSCTTAYKTGQTPDDVYYSAARPQADEDKTQKEERRDYTYNDDYYDDRYLRMKVRNRYQWNDLNDWYNYDRYSNGFNYAFGSYYNPYNAWHYNPYCCCQGNYYSYTNPKITSIKPIVRPTSFNLGSYTNTNYNNSNASGKSAGRVGSYRPVYNNSNSNTNGKGLSNSIRTIFSGNSNNNNGSSGSSSSSSRTYTPSTNNSSGSSSSGSSSSSSGSSGSSSGGSVSRPTRN